MRSTSLVLAGILASAGPVALGACGGGGGDGGVYFDLASPLDTGDVFWDLPFPSDLRLNADGTIDLTGFPNPRNVPLVEKLLIDARVRHGFAQMPVAYFRFRDPPPARSVDDVIAAAPASDAFLVDVDPASPERGALVPVVAQTFPVDGFAPASLVGIAPRPGFVLAPHTRYAVVLRQSFAPGVAPAPDFATLADGGTPGGDRGAAARDLYQPLWDTLATLGVDPHDVLVATVFTTGDEVQVLYDRTEQLRAAYDAPIADLHVDPTDGATHDGFCEIIGTITLPQFQAGTQPFDSDGEFVLGADGAPTKQGEMTVPMTISLPLTTMPASGFPLYQFFHGSGGHSSDVVDLGPVTVVGGSPTPGEGPAFVVAKQGIAAAGDALPLNPERLPGASDTEYININNLAAFPYTFQQGAIEQRLFLDALLALRIDPAQVTGLDQCEARGLALPGGATTYQFDPAKLVAGGQSMGGMYTNMIGAVEPRFGALVPTGAGGFWNLMVLKTNLVPGAGALLAAAFQTDELQITFMHPGMHLLGLAWEIAEPMVSMSRLARRPLPGSAPRSIYEPVGYDDIYFPTQVYDAAALAYGNQEAGEQVWPEMQTALALDGLDGFLTYPITGNRTADGHTTTNVVVQYMGDGIDDPHYLYRQLDAVKHQYGCFLRSFLDTGTPTVPAPGALDDPCP